MPPPPDAQRVTQLDFADLSHYRWLSVPAWVFDTERESMVWANDAALAYWQADSLGELLARDFTDSSPAVRTRLLAAMAAHAEGRTTREQWTLYPRGQPTTSMLLGRGIVLPDGRDAILYVSEPLSASYDPSVLRGIEAMQHTPMRVAMHRMADGAILMRNPAAISAFAGLGAGDPAPPRDELRAVFADPALAEHVLKRLRRGQTFSGPAQLHTRNGATWHSLDLRPVLDPVTGDPAIQINARDISELMASEAALKAARDAAEAASRAKSAFLANVSHEIRTPMNGVLGLTELVLRTALDERQRGFLELAHRSAKSLLVIIDDILDLSKIEAERLPLVPQAFSLHGLVDEVMVLQRTEAEAKRLTLQWQIDPALPDRVWADPTRLRQMIVNLVGNAIKFTSHGGVQVEITGQALPDPDAVTLKIDVIDSGIGMNSEELDRVFDPFTQADSSITRRYGGTGLGLSIVRRLAQLMQGQVQARSTPGQGSVFTLTLRAGIVAAGTA